MRNLSVLLAYCSLLCLVLSCDSDSNNTITGTVSSSNLNAGGQPQILIGVTVQLVGDDSVTTVTNSSGEWSLDVDRVTQLFIRADANNHWTTIEPLSLDKDDYNIRLDSDAAIVDFLSLVGRTPNTLTGTVWVQMNGVSNLGGESASVSGATELAIIESGVGTFTEGNTLLPNNVPNVINNFMAFYDVSPGDSTVTAQGLATTSCAADLLETTSVPVLAKARTNVDVLCD